MPEIRRRYSDWSERQDLVATYEGQGYSMLHDDFDPDWKRGDEPHGTLTFTDEIPPVIPSEPARDPLAELDQVKVDIVAIKNKIGMK